MNITATWSLSLDSTCPHCDAYVDLLHAPDFWDGRKLEPCEHGTDNSLGVEVQCPDCYGEFTVDLTY
jgi:hypothetical protein